jgi:2-iminobutanoate/2-iminopropanoate deaminase
MSDRRYITAGRGLPKVTSPISHAVVVGTHCYVSGQLSIDGAGAYVPGTASEEAERAFANFAAALTAAGFTVQDVAFVDVAFQDLGDLPAVNDVWTRIFPENARPARTIYQAAALPFGAKVKVAGVAIG